MKVVVVVQIGELVAAAGIARQLYDPQLATLRQAPQGSVDGGDAEAWRRVAGGVEHLFGSHRPSGGGQRGADRSSLVRVAPLAAARRRHVRTPSAPRCLAVAVGFDRGRVDVSVVVHGLNVLAVVQQVEHFQQPRRVRPGDADAGIGQKQDGVAVDLGAAFL